MLTPAAASTFLASVTGGMPGNGLPTTGGGGLGALGRFVIGGMSMPDMSACGSVGGGGGEVQPASASTSATNNEILVFNTSAHQFRSGHNGEPTVGEVGEDPRQRADR